MHCTIYQTVRHVGVSEKSIKQVIHQTLHAIKKKDAGVSLHFIGDTRMKRLNTEYRGIQKTTDVLSFPIQEGEVWPGQNTEWGDIFISIPQIHRQARQYHVSYREELYRMLVHGILHLFGYDHGTEGEAKMMFALQERIVRESL